MVTRLDIIWNLIIKDIIRTQLIYEDYSNSDCIWLHKYIFDKIKILNAEDLYSLLYFFIRINIYSRYAYFFNFLVRISVNKRSKENMDKIIKNISNMNVIFPELTLNDKINDEDKQRINKEIRKSKIALNLFIDTCFHKLINDSNEIFKLDQLINSTIYDECIDNVNFYIPSDSLLIEEDVIYISNKEYNIPKLLLYSDETISNSEMEFIKDTFKIELTFVEVFKNIISKLHF